MDETVSLYFLRNRRSELTTVHIRSHLLKCSIVQMCSQPWELRNGQPFEKRIRIEVSSKFLFSQTLFLNFLILLFKDKETKRRRRYSFIRGRQFLSAFLQSYPQQWVKPATARRLSLLSDQGRAIADTSQPSMTFVHPSEFHA